MKAGITPVIVGDGPSSLRVALERVRRDDTMGGVVIRIPNAPQPSHHEST
jgi:hypothetical protein